MNVSCLNGNAIQSYKPGQTLIRNGLKVLLSLEEFLGIHAQAVQMISIDFGEILRLFQKVYIPHRVLNTREFITNYGRQVSRFLYLDVILQLNLHQIGLYISFSKVCAERNTMARLYR